MSAPEAEREAQQSEDRRSVPDARSATFRLVEGEEEYRACADLEREIWGEEFEDAVPPMLMQLAQKTGGVVGGAFDGEGGLLGFVYSFAAVEDGLPYQWSHMLAVREEARGGGLGRRLKLFQRRRLLELGYEVACWTFDPLVSRNAHLNLNRLGAEALAYVPDMYGEGTGSPLHAGMGTDRFLAFWELEGSRTLRAIAGLSNPALERYGDDAPLAVQDPRDGEGGGEPTAPFRDREAAVRIRIPRDVQALKAEEPEAVRRWRELTRQAFLAAFEEDYRVQGLRRPAADDEAPSYLLTAPGASERPPPGAGRSRGAPDAYNSA